jgi:hypothetical protein
MATHVNRGHFKRLKSGKVNACFVGNSIFQINQGWNVALSYVSRFPLACRGGTTNLINSVGAEWPITAGLSGMASIAAVRPGENPGDGTSKFNLSSTNVGSGDATGVFGSPIQATARPLGPNESDWDASQNMEVLMIAETSASLTGYYTNSSAAWNIQGVSRSNVGLGGIFINMQQAKAIRSFSSAVFNRGTGATVAVGRINAWDQTETGVFKPACFGVRCTNKTSGIFWGHMKGHGSWSTVHHQNETGATISSDGTPYTAAYSDEALIEDFRTFQWNYIFVPLGANETTTVGFGDRLKTIIARYKAAAVAAGVAIPYFCLLTQYDAISDGDAAFWAEIRAQTIAVAVADPYVECVDFGGWQRDIYGNYSAWSASQLVDTIHPATANSTLRDNHADLSWFILNGPITHGGGPRGRSRLRARIAQ